MARRPAFDRDEALRLRAEGLGYAEIARALGANKNTVTNWFRHAKSGPGESVQKRGPKPGSARRSPAAPKKPPAKKADASGWTDEKRLALVQCAMKVVRATGMSLGECAVELQRLINERKSER